MDNDIFDIECIRCDVKMHIIVTQNPLDSDTDDTRRIPLMENGAWTCPNCSCQNVKVRKN